MSLPHHVIEQAMRSMDSSQPLSQAKLERMERSAQAAADACGVHVSHARRWVWDVMRTGGGLRAEDERYEQLLDWVRDGVS